MTVRGFVESYKEKTISANDNNEISELPQKKRGRRFLLSEEIDEKVIEMAHSMLLTGATVNYNLVIAIVKGILLANDRILFAENVGSMQLGCKCCFSV